MTPKCDKNHQGFDVISTEDCFSGPSIGHAHIHTPSQEALLFVEDSSRITSLEQEITRKQEELDLALKKIGEQKDYIFTLSSRLWHAEVEIKEIRHCARAAEHFLDDIKMQQAVRYENSTLKDQLEKLLSYRQDLAKVETDSLGLSRKTLRKKFEFLSIDIKDACSSVDITTPFSAKAANDEAGDSYAAVEAWIQRATPGCSFKELVSSVLEAGGSELDVARFAAAAGMCELVFDSQFPDFLAKESPLLDQYRRQVLTGGTIREFNYLPWPVERS